MDSICATAAAPKSAEVRVNVRLVMCFMHSVSRNTAAITTPSQNGFLYLTKLCMMLLAITRQLSASMASCV